MSSADSPTAADLTSEKRSRPLWLGVLVKVVVTVAGFALLLLGVVMMVTPGPGLLGIVGGLALLATEYRWAKVWLHRAKAKLKEGRAKASAKMTARKGRGQSQRNPR